MKRSESQRLHPAFLNPPSRPTDSSFFVAYSGGLDSTVLLHLLASRGEAGLQAVHVHHGLQPAADEWPRHCETCCAALAVPLQILHVNVVDRGDGPESAAREARYDALSWLMREGDVLATAHHLDDQAETLLLRLLRGSGPRGLGAMRSDAPFPPGRLWRPLLQTPRAQLLAYAQQHGLKWIDDPHNADPRYARSWLRSQIMPVLSQRWPAAVASLGRSAALAAESADLLDEIAEEDHQRAAVESGLSVSVLRGLTAARRANLLRWWLHERSNLPPAPHSILKRIEAEVIHARVDAEPLLAWPGGELRRYRDGLYAMPPLPPAPVDAAIDWDGCGKLSLPEGCGALEVSAQIPRQSFNVRFVSGGERFQPQTARHARTLKNLFQEAGVPPWKRLRTPLLWRQGELLWVGGIGWSLRAVEDGTAFELHWRT